MSCPASPRPPRRRRAGQRGVALLAAILLVAIVVAIAASIGQRSRFDIAATSRVLESSAADALFSELERKATGVLLDDAAAGQFDAALERWARMEFAADTGTARGRARLADLQGRFNLNNLAPTAATTAPATTAPATTAPATAAQAIGGARDGPRAVPTSTAPGDPPPATASAPPGQDAAPVTATPAAALPAGVEQPPTAVVAADGGATPQDAGNAASPSRRFTFDTQSAYREFLATLPA
ncbi:MAG: hypothetical protein ACU85V_18645, partial [Gammaproteobacteria bacterium]